MTIELIKKTDGLWNWSSFGLYLPDFMWMRPEWDMCETEYHYGVRFDTRIGMVSTFGFKRYDFKIFGFGFYFARQWNY